MKTTFTLDEMTAVLQETIDALKDAREHEDRYAAEHYHNKFWACARFVEELTGYEVDVNAYKVTIHE